MFKGKLRRLMGYIRACFNLTMLKTKTVQTANTVESFFKPIMTRWLSVLCFLVSVSFFLQTYDSAQVKITLFYAGIIVLLGLWVSSAVKDRVSFFTRRNFILLLPFLLYFTYVSVSFFLQPYQAARSESFLRFLLSSALFIIIFYEYDHKDISRLINAIIFTCWFVYGYGIVQIVNNYLVSGVDPLFWTDFFGKRVFSTIANPNFFADFCLFTFILILARWLLTKQKSLLLLGAAALVNIFFTESKGAWAALAVALPAFGFVYLNYFVDVYKKHRLKFNAIAIAAVVALGLLVGVYADKRIQSVNFRLSTWRAAFEMIEAKPIVGTGKGSFEYIYPAYKRPEIFYMENLHNAQTQHAENYYLETWAELGLLGFGLFLFCAFYLFKGVVKKLKEYNPQDAREKEKFFNLLGCFGALAAIYIHNFVDVSLYFVSTGLFAAIFTGISFNLAFGRGEKVISAKKSKQEKNIILLHFASLSAGVIFFALALYCASDFSFMTTAIFSTRPITFFVCWAFFLFCAFGTACVLFYAVFRAQRIKTTLIFTIVAVLLYGAWGFMKADNYTLLASRLAEDNDISAASYYTQVIKINPFSADTFMHRGMLFANRLDLTPSNNPLYGDAPNKLFNDYDRALRDFNSSLSLAPHSALIYYHIGSLQRNTAVKISKQPQYGQDEKLKQQVKGLYADAVKNLRRALLTDPVYDNTYYQLANAALDTGDFKGAYIWLLKYIKGPDGVVNQQYLARHHNDQKALTHLKFIKERLSAQEAAEAEQQAGVL